MGDNVTMYRFTVRWVYYGEARETTYVKPAAWEMGLASLWRWAEESRFGSGPASVDVQVIA